MHSLFTQPLRTKRDILLARQRARHIAGWFHFPAHDQACIAAGTFAIAAQALRLGRSSQLCIHTEDRRLHIFALNSSCDGPLPPTGRMTSAATPAGLLRLVKPLPAEAAELSVEDMRWLVVQLNEQASFNLFEEIQHQNEEMLALLHAFHSAQDQLLQLKGNAATTSAA